MPITRSKLFLLGLAGLGGFAILVRWNPSASLRVRPNIEVTATGTAAAASTVDADADADATASATTAATSTATSATRSASYAAPSAEDILSYECAKSVVTMFERNSQLGPVFLRSGLIFTSLLAQDGSPLLLVNGGQGNYAIALESTGVNQLRFELANLEGRNPTRYYLSYMHDNKESSRIFEFSKDRPPVGHDDLDYWAVTPKKLEGLGQQLNYAIHQTVAQALQALSDDKILPQQVKIHRIENCEYLSRQSPGLARSLWHNLDLLKLAAAAVSRRGDRSPANVR